MQISNLLIPDLEETLKSDPAQAAELAEELHSSDLAELIDKLPDDLAVIMLGALGESEAAAALDAMDPGRRAELFQHISHDACAGRRSRGRKFSQCRSILLLLAERTRRPAGPEGKRS